MIYVSELSPRLLLKADLPVEALSESLLCVNGLKILIYADTAGGIELTKLGYFKRRFVEWAAQEFQWPDYEPSVLYSVTKVLNEPDFPPLCSLHDMLLRGRYIRHLKGRAVLTKIGRQIVDAPGRFQATLFDLAFLDDGPYGFSPGIIASKHTDIDTVLEAVGNRLGDWTSLAEFTAYCVSIENFPAVGPVGQEHEASLYVAINVVRPLSWLGLIEVGREQSGRATLMRNRMLRRTSLFDVLVKLVTHRLDAVGLQ